MHIATQPHNHPVNTTTPLLRPLFYGPNKSPLILLSEKNEGVVSKETVVLRRWGSSIQKFGFINGVDNVNWPPYRDSKS